MDPTKFIYAGTRGGGRELTDAGRVWDAVPAAVRARGPEATAEYLSGMDWSHIIPRSAGGSDLASNGLWEDAGLNRVRGAAQMTPAEIQAAQAAAGSEALRAALAHTAENALTGALVGAGASAVLAVLEEGLKVRRGEIEMDQAIRTVGRRIALAAAAGAAVAGLATAVVSAFPAVAPVLAAVAVPVAVVSIACYAYRLGSAAAGWIRELRSGTERRRVNSYARLW